MTDAPLYERDPAAWEEYLREGNRTQPRKRVAVDALIQDQTGRILLVNPGYKPGWDLPGGMAEENEPPRDTVLRELLEELALDLNGPLPLLCIDWVPPHGPWDDLLAMVYSGGMLSPEVISTLRIADSELEAFEFCTVAEAEQRLQPRTWRRTSNAVEALRTGQVRYLQDGHCA
jgi:ADP-ribose pyrophosphatase YjhB (NUDIX family)